MTSIGNDAFEGCSGLTTISIPNSVTSIGSSAFYNCSGLTSITIPNSVTSIGNDAFRYCSGLTSVTIGNSVTSIGESAFYKCSNLTSVTIGNSVTSIGERAFCECGNLTSVTIPNSVESIGNQAFSSCWGLTSVTIGNSVTSIGKWAFSGCIRLTSINIPESVTCIHEYAFYNCINLTSVYITDLTAWCNISFSKELSNPFYYAVHLYLNDKEVKDLIIPENTTSIGSYAFYGCSGLTSVTIPEGVTSIGEYAFYGCRGMTSVTIGSGVETIGNSAFKNCNSLKSVTLRSNAFVSASRNADTSMRSIFGDQVKEYVLGNTIESIGSYTFYNCSGLNTINIPNRVTSIGSYAFSGCSGLASVSIPKNVSGIGDCAFAECSSLTSVTVERSTPVAITEGTFSNRSNATLYVLAGSKEAYAAANYWKEFKEIVEIIPQYQDGEVFMALTGEGVEMKFQVISAQELTCKVYGTSSETAIPKSTTGPIAIPIHAQGYEVTVICESAFKNCSDLTSVSIPEGVTSIGDSAFDGCNNLTSVTLGSNAIASMERTSSSSMKTIFGEQVKKYTIGDGVASIGEYAFYDCSGLTSVTIGSGVTNIGSCAFCNCSSLTSITIPESVTSIEWGAFSGCTSLTYVTMGMGTPVTIEERTFSNREKATLYVPEGSKAAYEAADYWKEFRRIVEVDFDILFDNIDNAWIMSYAINGDFMDQNYGDYLQNIHDRFSLLLPSDKAMEYYYDPASMKSRTPRAIKFSFQGGPFPVKLQFYNYYCSYNQDKGTIGTIGNMIPGTSLYTNGEVTNRLKDILESHTIIHDGSNPMTHADQKYFGIDSSTPLNEYFLSKNGTPIKIIRDENDKIIAVKGGFQLENERQGIESETPGVTICNITEPNETNNGYTFVLDAPLVPTYRSVYSIFTNDADMKYKVAGTGGVTPYSEFYDLCTADGYDTEIIGCGLVDGSLGKTQRESALKKFRIFICDNGLDYNVQFFNNYRYTIFVPTNDAVLSAIADGLPTWEKIREDYQSHCKPLIDDETGEPKLTPDGEIEYTDELQTYEDSVRIAAKIIYLTNFVRYHFVENSVFDDKSALAHQEMVTACYDWETGQFRKIHVDRVNEGNQTKLRVCDDVTWKSNGNSMAESFTTIATDSEGKDIRNVLARDISCSSTPVNVAMKGITINSSSAAVIHSINGYLNHTEVIDGRHDKTWEAIVSDWDAIKEIRSNKIADINSIKRIYDLNGRELSSPQRGINIIRCSDGTTRKVLVK